MLRVSSKFSVAFLALALTALVSILAACGDSGTGGGGSNEKSSSSKDPENLSSGIQNENVNASLVVDIGGTKDETLTIEATVTMEDPDMKFDHIDIKLSDGTSIVTNVAKGEWTYQLEPSPYYYEFSGKDFCDGKTYQVQLYIYLEGKSEPAAVEIAPFERKLAKCDPPSSSSISSSSVAVLSFEQIKFSGQDTLVLNSMNGTRGVIFGSATVTDNQGSADIYYAEGGNAGKIMTGSDVKMITSFDRSQGSGDFNQGTIGNFIHQPPNGIYPPSTSSQFVFVPSSAVSEFDYKAGIYYVIRTNNSSGPIWTTNDFLMAIPDESPKQGVGNNKTIRIVAWKIK